MKLFICKASHAVLQASLGCIIKLVEMKFELYFGLGRKRRPTMSSEKKVKIHSKDKPNRNKKFVFVR